MSRRRPEIVLGLAVVAAIIGYIAWQQSQNAAPNKPASGNKPVTAETSAPVDLLPLVVDDEIPGLSTLLASAPTAEFVNVSVGHDPRLYDRGIGPDRIAKLDSLTNDFEALASGSSQESREEELSVARAEYAMALITAERTGNDSTDPWGTAALEDLERMHQREPDDWEIAFPLARLHRLLGHVEQRHDHGDAAMAHQLFAADLIRQRFEAHPAEANLQLELGIQLTYLAEAQLEADQAQLAFETFKGASECFETSQALLGEKPESDSGAMLGASTD